MAGGMPMGGDPRVRGCLVRLAPLLIAGLFALFVAWQGCQQGPFGRRQIVAMNPQQEQQLGFQAFQQVLQENGANVIRNGPAADAVKEITRRLVRATTRPDFLRASQQSEPPQFEWDVRLIRSKEVNAFCLPGGKMVVYTGIMPVAQTYAGLATVMGHEISHALSHHGAERMAQSQIVNILMGGAGATLSDMDPQQQQQVMQVLNAGAQFGILKYSRKHETEADHMGLLLMAAAGYDPHAAIKFWERMEAATAGGQRPPEFMSTHPSHETRIRDLTNWVPDAEPLYRADPAPDGDERLPPVDR
jgi:metalloendopeptidase OMA1, mitochondrial